MGHHNSKSDDTKISQEEIDELKNCTEFRGSEIQNWYKRFMNDYPAGVITKPQFIQTYKNMYPNGKLQK